MAAIRTHTEAPYEGEGEGISDVLLLIELPGPIAEGFRTDHLKNVAQAYHELQVGGFDGLRALAAADELQCALHASFEVEGVQVGFKFRVQHGLAIFLF